MKSISSNILHYITQILLFEIGLAVTVGLILFWREHSLAAYGNWMFWAGLIVLGIGTMSLMGGLGITRGGLYQLGQSVSEQDSHSKLQSQLEEERASFSFLQLCAGVGILALVISALV